MISPAAIYSGFRISAFVESWGMDHLYLREVDHTQARDNFRVILKMYDEEIDVGSIRLMTSLATIRR